jgi:hypothetical protein
MAQRNSSGIRECACRSDTKNRRAFCAIAIKTLVSCYPRIFCGREQMNLTVAVYSIKHCAFLKFKLAFLIFPYLFIQTPKHKVEPRIVRFQPNCFLHFFWRRLADQLSEAHVPGRHGTPRSLEQLLSPEPSCSRLLEAGFGLLAINLNSGKAAHFVDTSFFANQQLDDTLRLLSRDDSAPRTPNPKIIFFLHAAII